MSLINGRSVPGFGQILQLHWPYALVLHWYYPCVVPIAPEHSIVAALVLH